MEDLFLKKHYEIVLDMRKLHHKDIGNLPKFMEVVSTATRIIAQAISLPHLLSIANNAINILRCVFLYPHPKLP